MFFRIFFIYLLTFFFTVAKWMFRKAMPIYKIRACPFFHTVTMLDNELKRKNKSPANKNALVQDRKMGGGVIFSNLKIKIKIVAF